MPNVHRASRLLAGAVLPTAAILAIALPLSLFDALAASMPLAAPFAWVHATPAARRALRWRLPLAIAFAIGAALWLAGVCSANLTPPAPAGEVVGAAIYVLLCMAMLHGLRALLLAVARDLLPRRIGRVVAGVVLVAIALPLLFCTVQTHRLRVPEIPDESPNGGCDRADFDFASADGTRLRGTLLVPRPLDSGLPQTGVVVCHGIGANRAVFFDLARLAADCGACALAFDFRGHGESGGHVATFGLREADDVVAAADELRCRTGVARVVLLGVSMGGASALLAAERARADAVFAESSFADLRSVLTHRTSCLGPVAPVADAAVALAARLQPGIDLDAVSPRRALAALPTAVSVVLAHAGSDGIVPVDEGRVLAAARPGVRLEVFLDAWHGGCMFAEPERYRALLLSLLEP